MLNLKSIILDTLKQTDITVNYYYPQNFNQLPIITYYELENRTLLTSADGEELLSEITYSIDVWSKESTSEISIKIDELMRSIGFKRTSSNDLFEPDTKINHKVLCYSGQVTNNLQVHNNNY